MGYKDIVSRSDRYKDFKLLPDNEPQRLAYFLNGMDVDCVQVHSIQMFEDGHIVGFCGQFAWENNELIPLDDDTYNRDMFVLGYKWWSNDKVKVGLDILVGEDW